MEQLKMIKIVRGRGPMILLWHITIILISLLDIYESHFPAYDKRLHVTKEVCF